MVKPDSTVKSTVIVTLGNAAVKGFALLAVILLMRAFQPEQYGVIVTMLSVMAILPVVLDFGTSTGILRFGPAMNAEGRHGELAGLFYIALRFRIIAGILMLGAGCFIAKPLGRFLLHDETQSGILMVAFVGSVGTSILQLMFSALQASGRFRMYTATNLVDATLKVLLVASLVFFFPNAKPIVAVLIYSVCPVIALGFVLVGKPISKPRLSRRGHEIFRIYLRFSFWYMLSSIFLIIFTNFDYLIIAGVRSARETGYFGSGYKLASVLSLVAQSLMTVLIPKIGTKTEPAAFFRFTRKIGLACMSIALLLIPFAYLGPFIFRILGLEVYLPAISVFRLVAWDFFVMIMFIPTLAVMFALNRPVLIAVITGLEMILNIAGDILVVPRYGGAGAAAVTLAVRIFVSVLATGYLVWKIRSQPGFIRQLSGNGAVGDVPYIGKSPGFSGSV